MTSKTHITCIAAAALVFGLGCAGTPPLMTPSEPNTRRSVGTMQEELAQAYRALDAGQSEEALRKFEAALGHDPASIRALIGAGLAYLEKGDAARARQMLEKAEAKLEADTGEKGTPVLVLPATAGEVERGVEYIDYGVRQIPDIPGNKAILLPENKVGHVLLEPRGEGWAPLRWLGMTPFSSKSGAVGRFDEAGILWIVKPYDSRDIRIGAYQRGSLSPDGGRLFACNAKESVLFTLPEGKEIGRRSSGCMGRDIRWHVRWNDAGTLLFEGEAQNRPYNSDRGRLVVSAVPSSETVFEDDKTTAYGIHEPSGRIFVKRRVGDDEMELVIVGSREKKVLATRKEKYIGGVGFSPDGSKVAIVGASNAIFDIRTERVEDFGPTHTVNVTFPASPAHFTNDGRYCINRNNKWRLNRAAPRPGHAEYCFPHDDGSATTAQIPITPGFVPPSDAWEGIDFRVTEALSPDRKMVAIIEQAEEQKPAGVGYVPPERFLVLVDVASASIVRRIPLGRFTTSGNGTFVVGPAFSKDGTVVTVPVAEYEASGFVVATGKRVPPEKAPNPEKLPPAPHELVLQKHALPPVEVQFEGNRALFLNTEAPMAMLWDLVQGTKIRTERQPGLCFAAFAGHDFEFATCDTKPHSLRSELYLHSSPGDAPLPMDGLVVEMNQSHIIMGSKEGMTIYERKNGKLEELQRLPLMFGEMFFDARGNHLVVSGFGFGGPGSLVVLEIPSGRTRFERSVSCYPFRMLPGDVIQCGFELLDLDGAPVKRPLGSPPIVLTIDSDGHEMSVDEGGAKPISRPLDALLWQDSAKYITSWSTSEDGRHLFVGHNHGIVTVHAMAGGARLVMLVPTREGSVAFLPGGYVETTGEPPKNLACRFGEVLVPFQVCAERRTVRGGMARTMAGDLSFASP
ncbi:MAG: tetratricopeptide repeat protein [Polyangiaceae bacterium]|nr:tetratricopeptide repeat protein [Polyangiaceae bacterium]